MRIILISILSLMLLNKQVSSQTITSNCIYYTSTTGYTCMLIGLVYDNTKFITVEGTHILDKTDFDVTGVEFYGSTLTDLPINIFTKFFNLQYLNLNFGNLINVDATTFAFAVNMKKLDATYNKVKKLDGSVFSGASLSLEAIDMSNNEISEINPAAFAGLVNLKSLNLNFNKIVSLPPSVFSSLASLNTLLLDFNQLEALPAKLLDQSVNMKAISMMFNKITEISPTLFSNLKTLETVFLLGNICISNNIYLAYEDWETISLPKFSVCFKNINE